MIQAIVRRCPNIRITFLLEHCKCAASPIAALESETFPGVARLVVCVGSHEPEDDLHTSSAIHRKTGNVCSPSAQFWSPFVNGITFPDCEDLELHHYWAASPSARATIDYNESYEREGLRYRADTTRPSYGLQRFGARRNNAQEVPARLQMGSTSGLKKIKTALLEYAPEINSALLVQLLGNPNSVASNLTSLELKFCTLDKETISSLLHHAPPKLNRLILLRAGGDTNNDTSNDPTHLCPLIRDFTKNMVHMEYAASMICNEIFFDDAERASLSNSGIAKTIEGVRGTFNRSENLDGHSIRETIQACRTRKRNDYRNDRIKEAIVASQKESTSPEASPSLFGGISSMHKNSANKAQREVEAILDEIDEKRRRLIKGSKTPWFRRIISWDGLCTGIDSWAEIQLAAEMEEPGVEWILVNKTMPSASQHTHGKSSIDVDMRSALEEIYGLQ
ncbi:hypothetical protein MMC21_003496 [Puttea exsequens]|nr:hypothetical protein [Puttea exsequens]